MSLIALVYVSFAQNRKMSDDELKNILTKAREKNQQKDVTGMLLYRNGFFVQVLEGDKQQVEDTFKVIRKDPRHNNLLMLYKNNITERSFEDWSMGFSVIDDQTLKSLDGFNDFLDKPLTMDFFKENPSHVMTLLNTFKRVG